MAKIKTFDPKPFAPGSTVTWTHYPTHGVPTERSGMVWSGADGTTSSMTAVWVVPDEPWVSDIYSAIYVMRPGARRKPVVVTGGAYARPGEAFSSDDPTSDTGVMMKVAARHAAATRASKAAA